MTVFFGFFETTSDYFSLLKNTFLLTYISNSIFLLVGVLFLTFVLGVGAAYCVSFYDFPGVNFSKNLIKKTKGQHIAASAIQIASDLNIRAAVVITRNGRGARYLSNLRPHGITIYSFTDNTKVLTSNILYRGVYPFLLKLQDNPEDTIQDALKILKNTRKFSAEEQVIVLANILTGEGYNTSLQIRSIPPG